MNKKLSQYLGLILIISSLLASSCAKKNDALENRTQEENKTPIVTEVAPKDIEDPKNTVETTQLMKKHADRNHDAISGEVTLVKERILNRTFLYGADLQYSNVGDPELSLTLQALTVGHMQTYFKILGGKLQLLEDNSLNYESDVNHPSRLIHEFKIIKQNEKELTISIQKASPILATLLSDNPKEPNIVRTSWVRSINFVEEGNYLMFESSLEDAHGNILEMMEAVFPRDTLIAKEDKPIFDDADLNPDAERFRFLNNGSIFANIADKGRVLTRVASRFALAENKTIDWYVTNNIPDEYLPYIKSGIEGWNRYFTKMLGRDGLRFLGKLPEGIKIGDPRYNIVNWDNIAKAGAAYESQASDPATGIQSHSLIYLPLAWVNIGKEYWQNGQFSDASEKIAAQINKVIQSKNVLGKKLNVSCISDATAHLALNSLQNPKDFALELLKGVLFHEVGHALGLAHNFKGSLSYDPEVSGSIFTTSIMDYNQYQIERDAYDSLESSNGPLLEYDRQILSVLYHQGSDILASDARVPTCNDDEADYAADGIDPLCIRYDAGKDPTRMLELTIDLVTKEDSKLGETVSLLKALKTQASILGDGSALSEAKQVQAKLKEFYTTLAGTFNFYIASGAQSLSYMAFVNTKILRVFSPTISELEQGYDENLMHSKAWSSINYLLRLEQLPEQLANTQQPVVAKAKEWLQSTAYFASLEAAAQNSALADIEKAVAKVYQNVGKLTLSKARNRLFPGLARVASAPFFLGELNQETKDLELEIIKLLAHVLSTSGGANGRPITERMNAAKTLTSFAGIKEGREAIASVVQVLEQELLAAKDGLGREQIRALMGVLN